MQFINGLHFKNIRGDIYGGLTAAVVALPVALAMGVASGAGPIAGIYGAIFVGFFAAILGGTPAQVSGPTAPMTVVMALIFTEYAAMFPNDPEMGAALAFSIVVMAGLFQIAFGLLKMSRFIELVPHPVISGFMTGIGVIMIVIQIGPLLGHTSSVKPVEAFQNISVIVSDPHQASLILAVLALLIVYGMPRFLPQVNRLLPSSLLALVIGTVSYLFFFQNTGVSILGQVPTGLPDPVMPVMAWDLMPGMILSALFLAVLASLDSLLTSVVADNVTRTQHKPDRELIGQGIGNAVAGLFGGLPGAGATRRTMVNVKAGGQTPISGVLHALVLLAIVLAAGGLASEIPNAVLAAILIKVGTDIIDWEYLAKIRIVPKAGVIIMLTVLLMTVVVDPIMALATGMVMASLLFLHRVTDLQLASMLVNTKATEEMGLDIEETSLLAHAKDRVVLFEIGSAVGFGAAKGMMKRLARFDDYDVLVIDMTEVPVIDYTACRALDNIIADTIAQQREVMLVGVRSAVTKVLKKQKVLDRIHSDYIFVKRIGALREALNFVNSKK